MIGKAGGESKGTEWVGVVPRVVLVIGVGVGVWITDEKRYETATFVPWKTIKTKPLKITFAGGI